MSNQTDAGELDALLAGIEPQGEIAAALLESLADEDDHVAEEAKANEDDNDHDKVVTFGNEESDAPEIVIDTQAIYEGQGSNVKVADDTEAAQVAQEGATTEAGKKRKKTKAKDPDASSTPTPVKMNSFTSKSEAFAAKADVTAIFALGIDEATFKKALDEAPLKVREKAYNSLRFAAGREGLSNYTRAAFTWLWNAPGMTTVNLVEKFKAGDPNLDIKAYNEGTARSQAQQQSRLLGILGIVDVSGKAMTLKSDHALVKVLASRLSLS